jgi:uncharacterized membrane protein YdjX (TVP38/TMEM64 family)
LTIERTKKKRWLFYLILLFFGLIILCFSFMDICPLIEIILPSIKINKANIINFLDSLGPWGPVSAVSLMVLHSFVPFPAEFLALANGMVYGPFWGVTITWIGAMLGAFASFGLTKHFGRPFVEKKVSPTQLKKLDQWFEQQGAWPLLLSRLIPLISFNLINYGAGMTNVSWWTFTWTTGVGILPITIIMVTMGNNFNILPWWGWVILLGIIIGTTYLVSLKHRKRQ